MKQLRNVHQILLSNCFREELSRGYEGGSILGMTRTIGFCSVTKTEDGRFLVVQWLRTHLAMQRMEVQFLVWELTMLWNI